MKNLKRLIVCALTLGMVVAMSPVNMLAAENLPTEQWDLGAARKGKDIILENISIQKLDNDVTCMVIEGTQRNVTENTRGIPEKTVVKNFQFRYFDRNNILVAVFDVVVTGVYDQTQNTAFLTNISGTFSGDLAYQFAYSSSISGSAGYLTIYLAYEYLHDYVFNIATNGTISYH